MYKVNEEAVRVLKKSHILGGRIFCPYTKRSVCTLACSRLVPLESKEEGRDDEYYCGRY